MSKDTERERESESSNVKLRVKRVGCLFLRTPTAGRRSCGFYSVVSDCVHDVRGGGHSNRRSSGCQFTGHHGK